MRITIIPLDGTVAVDGRWIGGINMYSMAPDIHAVQWYDTWGEVEFVPQLIPAHTIEVPDPENEGGVIEQHVPAQIMKPQNEIIYDLTPFQPVIVLWEQKRDAEDAAAPST